MIYIWDMCKPVHRRWGGGCKDGDGVARAGGRCGSKLDRGKRALW